MNKKWKGYAFIILVGIIIGNVNCPTDVYAQNVVRMETKDDAQSNLLENGNKNMDESEESIEESTQEEPTEEEPTESVEQNSHKEDAVIKCKVNVNFCKYNYKNKKILINWKTIWKTGGTTKNKKSVYYKIYLSSNGDWKKVGQTDKTKAQLSIPCYGKEYSYKVKAFIKKSKDTTKEEVIEEEVNIGTSSSLEICLPKSMSKIVTTAISSKKVKLSWNEVKGATQYIVYQKNNSGKFKQVIQTSRRYLKLDTGKDQKYDYKVVPIYKKKKLEIFANGKEISFSNGEFVSMDHQKYTYKEMETDIKALTKKYGEYVAYESIGKSEQGREIYSVRLGNPDAKKSIMVVSTLHAREYAATVSCMKQLEYYLMNYNKKVDGVVPAEIFDKCCVYYIMMANPDGVMISQNGDSLKKTNAKDVNLNNDFPNSMKEGHENRAAETRAIIAYTNEMKNRYKLYVVNYHAMGQIVFGSYGGDNKSVKKNIKNMYKIARETTGYADSGSYSSSTDFSKTGGYRDYLSYLLEIPSITIEVGSTPCPVPQREYGSIFRKNKLVVLREACYTLK